MLYSSIEKKLKMLPQSALEEVSSYVDYIFFKLATSEKIATFSGVFFTWILKRSKIVFELIYISPFINTFPIG